MTASLVPRTPATSHVETLFRSIKVAQVCSHNDLVRVGVNIVDVADITVVDLLVVVVLDLHHLVAGGKGPAEPLDLAIAGGIERCLQLDVQRPRAYAAPVHRT